MGMDMLSYKTALWLSLCSARRICDIHALSVHLLCIHFALDDSKVVLHLNPAHIPKVPALSFKAMTCELSSFSLPPFALAEQQCYSSIYIIYALCAR